MAIESVYPFLLVLLPFAGAFVLEALVVFFFQLKSFWIALGFSVVINLISLVVLYGSTSLLATLGYVFNGLLVPIQILLFFWWISVIFDGLFLQLVLPKIERRKLFAASLTMNSLSYLFLYFFISNSH